MTSRSQKMTTPAPICESEHEFTLILSGVTDITTELEDALFDAGCSDATISMSFGRVYLEFVRREASLKDAIISAINDVRASAIDGYLVRVDECDLVTPSEIARRIDRPRQVVHQYIHGERGPGRFPPPTCNLNDGAPLWDWCEVAYWLCENSFISEEKLRNAQDLAIINHVLELENQRRLSPDHTQEIVDALIPCSS